ncbi:ATP-dependent DNA helicase [Geofilum rubicundum]|uniref:RecD-like DNA helicase Atu2026 n=1 Tax=Geofilum rubicundum JCM 15548 TaxID=1236989 RepID=A0A0E9LRF9_9BACT|nr:AAA family ATPase [Geofilum rubicundum]GAO27844.1 RecD-like DNA helicase Atu2026 [Geofilum rubicundum JCM 15548]
MLKEHIFNTFKSHFTFEPTVSQLKAMEGISHFLGAVSDKPMFLLQGYAGTGKTTLMRALVQSLNDFKIKAVLLAPTGRAAKVLSNHVEMPAFTIHKKIYRQQGSKDGFGGFNLNDNLHKNTVFIVDEASMIANNSYGGSVFGSGRLLDDLIQFVYSGESCRLLLIGDTAQLPPVGISMSPALERTGLEAYGLQVWESSLTDVLRQQEGGGILHNATALRRLLDENEEIKVYPKIETRDFKDVLRITGTELMDELNYCYDHYGLEETLVVCRTNKRANLYNQGIRNTILYREEELATGDYLLVMKNNYFWIRQHSEISFIANGDIARVLRIQKNQDLYGYRFADITCELVDYKNVEVDARIILDSLQSEGAGFSREQQETFFSLVMEDYQDIRPTRKQYEMVRNNEFYNALQIKFAYAMTAHKAQGGQWKAVFVDLGYFTEDFLSRDLIRWLYTAVTRATERLYLVNFPKEFLSDE